MGHIQYYRLGGVHSNRGSDHRVRETSNGRKLGYANSPAVAIAKLLGRKGRQHTAN